MCLATCVGFARCSRSALTGKHPQRCNTHAWFSRCWKASWYLQQDFSVEALCEIPTSRTWVPHADRDINMLALIASLALSQDGIPNALCVILTIARSHTEVLRLRLDRPGGAQLCVNIALLHAATEVGPGRQQSCR